MLRPLRAADCRQVIEGWAPPPFHPPGGGGRVIKRRKANPYEVVSGLVDIPTRTPVAAARSPHLTGEVR